MRNVALKQAQSDYDLNKLMIIPSVKTKIHASATTVFAVTPLPN